MMVDPLILKRSELMFGGKARPTQKNLWLLMFSLTKFFCLMSQKNFLANGLHIIVRPKGWPLVHLLAKKFASRTGREGPKSLRKSGLPGKQLQWIDSSWNVRVLPYAIPRRKNKALLRGS